jgi:small-conductance mechanosensitive channel
VEVLPENLKGQVIDSNLMFVVMREDSGTVIQIPNNMFFQKMFRVTGSGDLSFFEAARIQLTNPMILRLAARKIN